MRNVWRKLINGSIEPISKGEVCDALRKEMERSHLCLLEVFGNDVGKEINQFAEPRSKRRCGDGGGKMEGNWFITIPEEPLHLIMSGNMED